MAALKPFPPNNLVQEQSQYEFFFEFFIQILFLFLFSVYLFTGKETPLEKYSYATKKKWLLALILSPGVLVEKMAVAENFCT